MPRDRNQELHRHQGVLAAPEQKLEHTEARAPEAVPSWVELHRVGQVLAGQRWGKRRRRSECFPITPISKGLLADRCDATSCAWPLRPKHKTSLATFYDLVVWVWNQLDTTDKRTLRLSQSDAIRPKVPTRIDSHPQLEMSSGPASTRSVEHLSAEDFIARQEQRHFRRQTNKNR